MVLILAIGAAAAAAISLYNNAMHKEPERAQKVLTSFRQTTGVIAALVTAVVAVLDALALVRRVLPQTGPVVGQPPPGKAFGTTTASDVVTV